MHVDGMMRERSGSHSRLDAAMVNMVRVCDEVKPTEAMQSEHVPRLSAEVIMRPLSASLPTLASFKTQQKPTPFSEINLLLIRTSQRFSKRLDHHGYKRLPLLTFDIARKNFDL